MGGMQETPQGRGKKNSVRALALVLLSLTVFTAFFKKDGSRAGFH